MYIYTQIYIYICIHNQIVPANTHNPSTSLRTTSNTIVNYLQMQTFD